MTYDYTGLAGTAKRLIENFGKPIVVKQFANSGTPYDPTTSEDPNAFVGVVLNYRNDQIDGTLVQASDFKVLISPVGADIVPKPGDEVEINLKSFKVVTVKPLEPGGLTVMWELQARA